MTNRILAQKLMVITAVPVPYLMMFKPWNKKPKGKETIGPVMYFASDQLYL